MPPAFNLSQDQTLQFDLELLIKELKKLFQAIFNLHERLKSIRPRVSKDSWHSPSNAHAYRLLIFKELRRQTAVCCVALTCCQRRSGILSCFSKPCQALSFHFVFVDRFICSNSLRFRAAISSRLSISEACHSMPDFKSSSSKNFRLFADRLGRLARSLKASHAAQPDIDSGLTCDQRSQSFYARFLAGRKPFAKIFRGRRPPGNLTETLCTRAAG